ncbi:MAG: hypothetical protein U0840_12365 [Gemmataceae bacterium]
MLILDALEEAEAALRPRALRRSFTPGSPKAGWAWLPTPLAMAAQGATAGGLVRLRWRSPGGEFRAVLVADPADLSARTVRVNFLAGSSPAVALVGWPARLAGCVAILDAEANADFDLAVVAAARQAGRQCDLAVGEEQQVWLLETGS